MVETTEGRDCDETGDNFGRHQRACQFHKKRGIISSSKKINHNKMTHNWSEHRTPQKQTLMDRFAQDMVE